MLAFQILGVHLCEERYAQGYGTKTRSNIYPVSLHGRFNQKSYLTRCSHFYKLSLFECRRPMLILIQFPMLIKFLQHWLLIHNNTYKLWIDSSDDENSAKRCCLTKKMRLSKTMHTQNGTSSFGDFAWFPMLCSYMFATWHPPNTCHRHHFNSMYALWRCQAYVTVRKQI